jgi:hypothetical protein
MKTNALPLILIPLLICFASLRPAEAVDPPPDGGYPRGNTAEGSQALLSLTDGTHNTAVGENALGETTGGNNNTATGFFALRNNRGGDLNTATGALALHDNAFGKENTATGFQALHNNTNGDSNTATGINALSLNTTSDDNSAFGSAALYRNTTGRFNSATGSGALFSNTKGDFNSAIGSAALQSNTIGNFNVALGDNAGSGVITADDVICIGHAVAGVNVSGTCFIGNIRGVTTQNANALPVVIDGAGQLGTVASSERFKKDIAIMGQASEGILSLRPVTFHYKTDGENTPQFGLIAEEVAKVNPALVVPDKEGKPYTVRYDAVNAMLLNEFLKEHRKNEEQEKTIAELKSGMTALAATVKEQASQIQKVSAQLEVTKSAPQTAQNTD